MDKFDYLANPNTNKTIPSSSSTSTGIGLFETSAKAELGFTSVVSISTDQLATAKTIIVNV